jgi:hypothetical protein
MTAVVPTVIATASASKRSFILSSWWSAEKQQFTMRQGDRAASAVLPGVETAVDAAAAQMADYQ